MKILTLTTFFILFLLPQSGTGQSQKVIYPHTVFWHKTEANTMINDKLGYGFDWVYRRKNEMNEGSMFDAPLRNSFRPWINYQTSKLSRLSISPIGYMNTNEYIGKPEDYNRLPFNEWRSTFQFLHHTKTSNGKWMHTWRYRYELRWQENPVLENYRFFTRFRLRYRFRYMINTNDFYENKTLYAAVSNEIGLNMGKNVVLNTFNQNRLYVGLGYRFLNAARVELRYLDRFRTRGATGYEFDQDKGIMLGIYIDDWKALGKEKVQNVRFSD